MARSCAHAIVDQSSTAPIATILFIPHPCARWQVFKLPGVTAAGNPTFGATDRRHR